MFGLSARDPLFSPVFLCCLESASRKSIHGMVPHKKNGPILWCQGVSNSSLNQSTTTSEPQVSSMVGLLSNPLAQIPQLLELWNTLRSWPLTISLLVSTGLATLVSKPCDSRSTDIEPRQTLQLTLHLSNPNYSLNEAF